MDDAQELIAWVGRFNQTTIPAPRLKSTEAIEIWNDAMNKLETILQEVEGRANRLNKEKEPL